MVLQSDPEGIRRQNEEGDYPFEILCDPKQVLYQKYHVAPALSMEKMADLKVLAKIGEARKKGFVHGAYEGNELQLPAVFVVEPGLKVTHAYYGTNPADIPAMETVAAWCKKKEDC